MAAPMQRMFPSWASHFNIVSDQSTAVIDPRSELMHLQCPVNTSKVLLSGTRQSGKTALLFQFAVSCAMDGMRVVFITQRKFDSMPLSVDGATKPDPILMKQVHIMYFDDRPSLLEYLAGIHTFPAGPEALIIDNLDYYVTHPKSSDHTATIGNLCAFLVDAATFLTNQRCQSSADRDSKLQQDCQILVSVSSPISGELPTESFYTFFLPTILRIQSVKELDNVFQLHLQQNGSSQTKQTITYEIQDSVRLLDISHGDGSSMEFAGD